MLREISAVKNFYSWLFVNEGIDNAVIANFTGPKLKKRLPRPLSEKDAKNLIEFVKNKPSNSWIVARDVAILILLYGCGLRISEALDIKYDLIPLPDVIKIKGKGNKERNIAVSDAMLKALKRWRKYLELSVLPSPADDSPLIPKVKGKGPLTDETVVRRSVQMCFDGAAENLKNEGFFEESNSLAEATVHWLRHTGISEDVKIRPREHVRDDAGHSSSAITERYIDIEKRERHASAKKKKLRPII